MDRIREQFFGWLGWFFVELSGLLAFTAGESELAFKLLGGGFFYKLGNICYEIAYDLD